MTGIRYNCDKCPAYCFTYTHIEVNKSDLRRLARHFGIDQASAEKRFTKKGQKAGERSLRHRADHNYGTACRFLDSDTRNCTIYQARPSICRRFPATARCGYYDFLTWERGLLEDPDHVAITCAPKP